MLVHRKISLRNYISELRRLLDDQGDIVLFLEHSKASEPCGANGTKYYMTHTVRYSIVIDDDSTISILEAE